MKLFRKPLKEQDALELVDSFLYCTRQFFLVETLEETVAQVSRLVSEYLDKADWAILLHEQQENTLQLCRVFVQNEQQDAYLDKNVHGNTGIINWAIRHVQFVITHNVHLDKRFDPDIDQILDTQLTSLAVFPIALRDSALGAIAIFNPFGMPHFDDLEIKFISEITDLTAIAITRAHRMDSLETAALTDPLTHQLNRRGFLQIIDQELERSKRYGRSIAIMMIDIDLFKQINDTYGHLKGDDILQHVSNILVKSVRRIDYICRYGGDEFMILMPDTIYQHASEVKHRIETMVTATWKTVGVYYQLSIGLYAGYDETHEEMFEHADKALYREKENKRQEGVR